MSYSARRYDATVSTELSTVMVHEIHFHLGDILPAEKMNYGESEDVTLKVIMHYSDPYGRDRTKTMTLPSTTIL
jgi:hypothetical protein